MGGKSDATIMWFRTKEEALDYAYNKSGYKFDRSITIKTSRSQDI